MDSNQRSVKQQIYSLPPLTTRELAQVYSIFPACGRIGAGGGTRTHGLLITNQLLCQLSYTSIRNLKPNSNPNPNRKIPVQIQIQIQSGNFKFKFKPKPKAETLNSNPNPNQSGRITINSPPPQQYIFYHVKKPLSSVFFLKCDFFDFISYHSAFFEKKSIIF